MEGEVYYMKVTELVYVETTDRIQKVCELQYHSSRTLNSLSKDQGFESFSWHQGEKMGKKVYLMRVTELVEYVAKKEL